MDNSTPFNNKVWRAANKIHDILLEGCDIQYHASISDILHTLIRISNDIEECRLTTLKLDRFKYSINYLKHLGFRSNDVRAEHSELVNRINNLKGLNQYSTVKEIYNDIIALENEFDTVEIDLKRRVVVATTDYITLEGVELGPFNILLYYDTCNSNSKLNYEVEALDPHPSGPNSDVMHPHLLGSKLCEGEAKPTIRQSLSKGRLYDFFMIVNNLLHTYNSGSPYVELEKWNDNHSCSECGSSINEDELTACQNCEEYLCEHCYYLCESCDNSYCCNCVKNCRVCGYSVCSNCFVTCTVCNRTVCEYEDCSFRCSNCHERVCTECADGCKECGSHTLCNHCLIECEECTDLYCDDCIEECKYCRGSFCKDCYVEHIRKEEEENEDREEDTGTD